MEVIALRSRVTEFIWITNIKAVAFCMAYDQIKPVDDETTGRLSRIRDKQNNSYWTVHFGQPLAMVA